MTVRMTSDEFVAIRKLIYEGLNSTMELNPEVIAIGRDFLDNMSQLEAEMPF